MMARFVVKKSTRTGFYVAIEMAGGELLFPFLEASPEEPTPSPAPVPNGGSKGRGSPA